MKMDENCLKANNLKIHPDFKKDFSSLMDNEKVGNFARFINDLDWYDWYYQKPPLP